MPFFRYRATDVDGKVAEGTLFAPDEAQARAALTRQGHTVHLLDGGPAGPVQTAKAAPLSSPVAAQIPATRPRTAEAPASPVLNASRSKPAHPVVRTRVAQDRKLTFLFSQLAAYFRSGVNPKTAFEDLAKRAERTEFMTPGMGFFSFLDFSFSRKDYAESLRYLAGAVGEGMSLSSALAVYPDLYPPDVVGTVRAGELGGFLPEACDSIAQQTMASHKFKRKITTSVVWYLAPLSIIPAIYFLQQASIRSMERQDAAGSSLPILQTVLEEVVKVLPSIAAWGAGIVLVALLVSLLVRSLPARPFRHWFVSSLPPFRARTRGESLGRFSWALSRISAAGIAPATAWEAAAQTMPNERLREQMLSAWSSLGTQGKLSEALMQSRAVGPEYVSMLQTGETTGSVPDMMDRVAKSEWSRFESADRGIPWIVHILLMILTAIPIVIAVAWFYTNYYNNLVRIILGDV